MNLGQYDACVLWWPATGLHIYQPGSVWAVHVPVTVCAKIRLKWPGPTWCMRFMMACNWHTYIPAWASVGCTYSYDSLCQKRLKLNLGQHTSHYLQWPMSEKAQIRRQCAHTSHSLCYRLAAMGHTDQTITMYSSHSSSILGTDVPMQLSLTFAMHWVCAQLFISASNWGWYSNFYLLHGKVLY